MIEGKILDNYCQLVLKIGVNLQPNQPLYIACPTKWAYVAEALTKTAYEMQAKFVRIIWENERIDNLNYLNADVDTLCEVPKWFVDSRNYLVENNYCYVSISAENPKAFNNIPPEKMSKVAIARSKALKKYSDAVMNNAIRWCVVPLPSKEWAEQIFCSDQNAQEKLSVLIEKCMRLDCDNPTLAWEKHIATLDKRAKFLNDANLDYLHFTNALGTDLKVKLADDHVFLSAKERAKDGIYFVANMPTEEIFTAPHKAGVNGIVFSALPLSYNGQIIDEFSLTFKKGKVVDFTAKTGYQTLSNLLKTDKGILSLGEVALIGKNSPIAQSYVLFFNTLFDENASCHLALGKAYPTTVKNGETLSKSELNKLGVNDSVEHVDFMIGTSDLSVIGVTKDNKKITLLSDGEWVI